MCKACCCIYVMGSEKNGFATSLRLTDQGADLDTIITLQYVNVQVVYYAPMET